jgi:hypothetical protein
MKSKLRIIVTGLVGLYPVGGVAWDYLQYVVGLSRLGHDVYYFEDTWSWPYHPIEKQHTDDGNYSAQYIGDFFNLYAPELKNRWLYFHLHETHFGMSKSAFDEVAKTADVFLNISGACMIPDELSPHCIKIFLDTDPGYNQIVFSERFPWSENVERWCQNVTDHDRHFTYAENIYGDDCSVPRLGFDWKTTRMPIVTELWGSQVGEQEPSRRDPWTTVMSWNAFKGPLIYQGKEYKSKNAEFEKLISLPKRTKAPFLIATGGITTRWKWFEKNNWQRTSRFLSDLARRHKFSQLNKAGWEVADGPSLSVTPQLYQQLISNSRGEFSVAKNVYVALRTGWFSCRSACYLAAGKPVVVQDTGFGSVLPTGEGIVSFSTLEEASDAIESVLSNYEQQAKAAHEIAEEYFNSDLVLGQLIDDALTGISTNQIGDVND